MRQLPGLKHFRTYRALQKPLLALLCTGLLTFPALAETLTVTLLQVNDVYQADPVDKGTHGGLARLSTLRQRTEAKNPHTFFVLGGDTLSPSGPASVFQGKHMISAWNAAGLDIAVLGNHEFDYGDEVLKRRLAESQFPWLGANVFEGGKLYGNIQPYVIKDVEGVKIAFLGLLTPDTKEASKPGPEVRFEDPIQAACKAYNELKKQGVDIVVGLTHLTMREDKNLARQLPLALIMGGHEHTLLQSFARSTPILKVGSDARLLGKIDLHIDKDSRQVQSIDMEMIPVTADIPEDPAVTQVIAPYQEQLAAALGEVVGKATVELDAAQRTNRSHETNLGNFIADSFREHAGTQVALVNGGSVRSNTTYGPGDITRKDVYSILPFKNPVAKVEVKGEILKKALENGVSRLGDEEAGRFPQVSGMIFKYDGTKPEGSRVSGVLINGAPLKPGQTYTLAITTYLLGGGDGYTMFPGAVKYLTNAEDAMIDQDVVLNRILKMKTVAPQVEGRIKRLDSQGI